MGERTYKFTAEDQASDKINKIDKSLANLAIKAATAGLAIKQFADFMGEAIELAVEQDAANGRLARSFRQAGDSAQDSARRLHVAQQQFVRNTKFGVTVLDQTNALQRLTKTSDNAIQAMEDLQLAIDIQADGVTDLQGATEMLVKIRQGDLGVLRDLGIASKDYEAALSGIENESDRVRIAMELVRKEFAGAAKETKGAADEIKGLSEQYKILKTSVGEATTRIYGEQNSFFEALAKTFGLIDENEESFDVISIGVSKIKREIDNFSSADILKLFALVNPAFAMTAFPGLIVGNAAARRSMTGDFDATIAGVNASEAGKREPSSSLLAETTVPISGMGSDKPKTTPRSKKKKELTFKESQFGSFADDITGFLAGAGERGAKESQEALKNARELGDALFTEAEATGTLIEIERMRLDLMRETNDEKRLALELAIEEAEIRAQGLPPQLEEIKLSQVRLAHGEKVKTAEKEAALAREAAVNMGIDGASQLTDAIIENEAGNAAIQVLVEGARAAAAFATFPVDSTGIARGAAHLLAATKWSVVAAKANAGATQANAKGGAPGGAQGFRQDSTDAINARQGQALGNINTGRGPVAPVVINFSSIAKPTPEDARDIADAVGFEMGNRA